MSKANQWNGQVSLLGAANIDFSFSHHKYHFVTEVNIHKWLQHPVQEAVASAHAIPTVIEQTETTKACHTKYSQQKGAILWLFSAVSANDQTKMAQI